MTITPSPCQPTIIMGIMTFTGWMNGISNYLNSFDSSIISSQEETKQESLEEDEELAQQEESSQQEEKEVEKDVIAAIDFTLTDQYGNEHTLSQYKGKVVFLNFWATWCPPCRKELPDIEELYHEYGENKGEVVILGVANPKSKDNINTRELDRDGVISFLEENGYTFPVVFDETGEILAKYYVSVFPTTFIIDKEGNIIGYAAGMLTKDIMKNAIEQALLSADE